MDSEEVLRIRVGIRQESDTLGVCVARRNTNNLILVCY